MKYTHRDSATADDGRPRVDRIIIHHEPDSDLSYLGRYSAEPGPDDRTVDRVALGHIREGCLHREYRYFIAAMSGGDTGNPDSVRQDYERVEAYNRGEWYEMGIYAVAEVSYATGVGSRRIERLQSGGLWGIRSDSSPEYIEEVEQNELDDLREHLGHFGVDVSNWDSVPRERR
jgi:hypothetical protein